MQRSVTRLVRRVCRRCGDGPSISVGRRPYRHRAGAGRIASLWPSSDLTSPKLRPGTAQGGPRRAQTGALRPRSGPVQV